MGLSQAGFQVVGAVDNWAPARAVYEANFNDHPIFALDLGNVDAASENLKALKPDLIAGGPPCQDFSSAGKRDESLGRADLTVSFAEIVTKCSPPFFLMENVARAANAAAFRRALDIFKEAGYGITLQVLDAAYCGAPQLRKRLIVVGSLAARDGFLDAALLGNLAARPLTVREYFGSALPLEHYYRHPRSYARRAVFSVDEPSATVRGVNRPVPDGYPGHAGDAAPVTAALRSLTTRERASIQTFPESYLFPGTKTDVEQVIGNAVPVALARYVATHLHAHMRNAEAASLVSPRAPAETAKARSPSSYRIKRKIDAHSLPLM
jgi:DNA (cytosine-5)-methyltransferase 1